MTFYEWIVAGGLGAFICLLMILAKEAYDNITDYDD